MSHTDHPSPEAHQGRKVVGLVLIIIGVSFYMQEFLGWNIWRYTWPVFLILAGLYLVTRRH